VSLATNFLENVFLHLHISSVIRTASVDVKPSFQSPLVLILANNPRELEKGMKLNL
jgi:hypothetical protein